MSSITRLSRLDQVFRYGKSELLNRLARLSVLYEDFRIEWYALRGDIPFGDLDTIGNKYRTVYFLRRSLATLNEYQGGLTQVLTTDEFKRAKPGLSEMDASEIVAANSYFQKNTQRIKELRNEFGGHLKLASVEFATTHFSSDVFGKVTWDSPKTEGLSLELHYANEVVAGAISSRLQGGANLVDELRTALEVIMQGYVHVQGSMLALTHAFLWDRFGR
jgi:hypothetical protein